MTTIYNYYITISDWGIVFEKLSNEETRVHEINIIYFKEEQFSAWWHKSKHHHFSDQENTEFLERVTNHQVSEKAYEETLHLLSTTVPRRKG